jgi:16S rRNA (uracil1498-N3)-methyltransferase
MMLFFHPDIPDQGLFTLDAAESKHLLRVLRKRAGDQISVTNGKGHIFSCALADENIPGCSLRILARSDGADAKDYGLHIAVSMLKNPARFEWFLEKATEIGVKTITPLICQRTEKQHFKPERFQNMLISAMKQSGRSRLPVLHPPVGLAALLKAHTPSIQAYIGWCGDTPKPLLKSLIRPAEDALILIGPEGDFTDQEVDLAIASGALAVSLGDSRLRTETAAIASCFTFNLINQ